MGISGNMFYPKMKFFQTIIFLCLGGKKSCVYCNPVHPPPTPLQQTFFSTFSKKNIYKAKKNKNC